MRQLIENLKNGKVQLVETPAPSCSAREVLVRNAASLISPGTEKLLIEMGQKNLVGKALARPDLFSLAYQKAKKEGFLNVFREAMDRLDEPLPLGYSCAGNVIDVGAKVRGLSIGDRVSCAGAAFASHADVVAVPEEMCVKLPSKKHDGGELSFEEASFVMLGGIALQGIRCAELTFGERIVVVGLGLIGLLLVQIGRAYGCTVIGVDLDPEKVALAGTLGCDLGLALGRDNIEQAVFNLTGGQGADAVILAAATKDNSPILLAERITRKRGRIVLLGVSDLALTRKAFWDKELTFTVSKASGPTIQGADSAGLIPPELVRWTESRNLQEFIRLLNNGSVKVRELITHRLDIENATAAYDMILNGRERYIGVVLSYGGGRPAGQRVDFPGPSHATSTSKAVDHPRGAIGVIGAGLFTKNVLLPTVSHVQGVRLIGIAARTGVSSRHVGKKFGFAYATTDFRKILNDAGIGSVLITTRHHLHADMIAEALAAGKQVFVEKPLCISPDQLTRIVDAYRGASGTPVLMVGFNRRYSPLGMRLRHLFADRTSPMQIHYRVNAGYLPPDHWTQDPDVGGGRIIGEVCHFLDFLRFLTSELPVDVFASSIGGNTGRFGIGDNVELTVRFSGGSLGTITYTALGSKTFSRERIEAYCDASVAVVEDFRKMEFIRGARKKTSKLWNQDMGYRNELEYFLKLPPGEAGMVFRDAALATVATFAAETSLRTRSSVSIALPEGV
jgi:predicted dehydrogenase/threonine dehydrogenase-like Zn-dependent dehydrogenase